MATRTTNSTPARRTSAAKTSATAARSRRPAVKAAKPAAPAAAPPVLPDAPAVPAAKAVKAPKPAKADKPVKAAKPEKEAKPAKAEKADKPVKADKLVRDSFTMPASDVALIAQLKLRAMAAGREARKSELLRAGLHALAGLSADALKAALEALTPVKTGRPRKGH
jgi:hypothetical protein